jgi:hypothetical protein
MAAHPDNNSAPTNKLIMFIETPLMQHLGTISRKVSGTFFSFALP